MRAFGLNGLLLLNVVLLADRRRSAAYLFLAARSSPLGAALFTTAFLGASAVPVYLVFCMPEILNVTLVTLAYFLWTYREVAPNRTLIGRVAAARRRRAARARDVFEAVQRVAGGAAGPDGMVAARMDARIRRWASSRSPSRRSALRSTRR